MFDYREVSWVVALARILLALVALIGGLAALDLVLYLDSTN